MIICMICYLKPYDIIAWLWDAKVWLWEIMKCYVYENDENAIACWTDDILHAKEISKENETMHWALAYE